MTSWDALQLVNTWVDARREQLVSLCARLVEAESVNPPGETRRAVAVLEDFLAGEGIAFERIAGVAAKPNLVAGIDGAAPGRHLVFNGHLDTIPPGDPAAWSVPVHALTRKEGRLYGHGMGNMKGAVAGLALASACLATVRPRWRGRLSFTAVADETVFGPDGAEYLLRARPDLRGDAVLCGEGPGAMGLALAEKGRLWIELRAGGRSGQGMLAVRGGTPAAVLAAALAEIDTWNDMRSTPPEGVACLAEHAGEHGLRLSVNIGILEGGRFASQTAPEARAEIDFRLPPGLPLSDLKRVPGRAVRAPSPPRVAAHQGMGSELERPREPGGRGRRSRGRSGARSAREAGGAPAGERCQPMARTRRAGRLLRPAAHPGCRSRRLRRGAGRDRLRQGLRPRRPGVPERGLNRAAPYPACRPPSTAMVSPKIASEAPVARKSAVPVMSSGR